MGTVTGAITPCPWSKSNSSFSLSRLFCRSGAPDVVWSDQRPQFTSRLFREFAAEWGFQHIMSSPRYPQSNGKAEAAVKSMKNLISAAWVRCGVDEAVLARALLQYRNTPSRRDALSPAQKLFGRPVQDTLPAHRRAFAPEWQRSADDAEEQARSNREYVEQHYNRHAWPLVDFRVGSNVALQNPVTKRWVSFLTLAHIASTISKLRVVGSLFATGVTCVVVFHHRLPPFQHSITARRSPRTTSTFYSYSYSHPSQALIEEITF